MGKMIVPPKDEQFREFREALNGLHGAELRRATIWTEGRTSTRIYFRSVDTVKGKYVAEQVIQDGYSAHYLVEKTYVGLFGDIPDSLARLYGGLEPS